MTRTEPAGGAERAFRPAVAIAALVGLALRVAWGQWVARPPQGLVDPVRYLGNLRAADDFWSSGPMIAADDHCLGPAPFQQRSSIKG